MVYLWRAVDHEGEILESYVTTKRHKMAALAFMKRARKRHGSPAKIVTDGLRPYPAAMREWGNGSKIGLKTATSTFDEENGPCSVSERCDLCKSSLPSTSTAKTISPSNVTSPIARHSRSHARPLRLSGPCPGPARKRRSLALHHVQSVWRQSDSIDSVFQRSRSPATRLWSPSRRIRKSFALSPFRSPAR